MSASVPVVKALPYFAAPGSACSSTERAHIWHLLAQSSGAALKSSVLSAVTAEGSMCNADYTACDAD